MGSSSLADLLLRRADPIPSGRAAADFDPARLHRLGQHALERDAEQAVLEAGLARFDEVGELEAPLERAGGDAAVQILALALANRRAYR